MKMISEKDLTLNLFKNVVERINSGEKFDILDYYLIPGMNMVDISKNINLIRNDVTKEEIMSFKQFISKNPIGTKLTEYNIKELFKTKDEIGIKRDENGNLIPGTGRIIIPEEKKVIFDFILDNDLPLTARIYNLVLNKYISNELFLEIPTNQRSLK